MANPKLPLTVPRALWDAIANDVRPEFADSYLSKAIVAGRTITPHTTIAYDRLRQHTWASKIIADLGFTLIKPLRFGHPDRPDTFQ